MRNKPSKRKAFANFLNNTFKKNLDLTIISLICGLICVLLVSFS